MFYILPLLFLLTFRPLYAQQLSLRTYSSRDGLIRSDVRALCQDSLGFLWLGTSDGLCRYDGVSFMQCSLPDNAGSNYINALLPEGSSLWIATNGGGLVRWRDNTAASFLILRDQPTAPENCANSVIDLMDRRLLVGTDRGPFLFDGSGFAPLPAEPRLAHAIVRFLYRDLQGNRWICTDSALYTMEGMSQVPERRISDWHPAEVRAMASGPAAMLWVGTDQGLRCITVRDRDMRLVPLPPSLKFLSTVSVRTLLFDATGAFWIGTEEDGIFKYFNDHLTSYRATQGLPSDRILASMEDAENNLWIATNAGVCKLADRKSVGFLLTGRLAHAYVAAITQDRTETFWFGTPNGLSSLTNGRFKNFSSAEGLPGNSVLSLLQDGQGNIWIGTTQGLSQSRGSPAPGRFTVPVHGLDHHVIRSLAVGADSTLWCGWERGVSALYHGRLITYTFPDSFMSPLATGLVESPRGTLWVATEGDGLFRFMVDFRDDAGIRLAGRYTIRDGLSDNSLRSLLVDRSQRLWIGTRFGGVNVCRFSDDSMAVVEHLCVSNGLSGDWVRSLLEDAGGNIWIATNRGVDRREPEGNLESILHIGQGGSVGDDAYTLFEDNQGDIWMGMSDGIIRYTPRFEPVRTSPPPVYVVNFQVFGRDDSTALRVGSTTLGYAQHSVAFEFIAPSFRVENAVRYRYMLEGLDSSWSAPTERHYVNYTHLPSGEYRFRVTARRGTGPWNPTPASFAFTIATPFWARWWFICAAAMTLIAALYGVYRLRVGHIMEIERVRNRIAADLHDDIGSTLSSITVFSRLAEQEVAATIPSAAGILRRIGLSSQAILESLDDIIWMVKPGNDSLDTIMLRIREYATRVCEAGGVALTIATPPSLNHLHMSLEDRRQLYLIVKEAVNNIIKHARCSHSAVTLAVQGKELTLTITDDGQGFTRGCEPQGDGLVNMQRRAKSMRGHLVIESAPGEGTTIVLRSKTT